MLKSKKCGIGNGFDFCLDIFEVLSLKVQVQHGPDKIAFQSVKASSQVFDVPFGGSLVFQQEADIGCIFHNPLDCWIRSSIR